MKKERGLFVLVFVFLLVVLFFAGSSLALASCQSGGLTTSVSKNYQMIYPNEDFIQIHDIDLLKDVSQLKDLTCLQYLDGTDRTIKGDIAHLKNLANLEVFSLYSNPEVYGDICSLAGATNLRVLKFAFDPKITGNISCLKNLTKLETVAMTHTQIYGDLSVFANMPNLKAIYVGGTNVSGDICALSKLTKLQEMGIADEYPGNPEIKGDLSCLDNLQKLKRVSIYNTATTNCEQFTKSHPNIAQMGPTESGRPAGGGCSTESLKTLVDVAQKYEKKIGKEVQTEVRGKPDYNKPEKKSEKKSEKKTDDIKEIELMETQKKSAISEEKQDIFTRIVDWFKSIFKKTSAPADATTEIISTEDIERTEKQAPVISVPTVTEKFIDDGGPPQECIVEGVFIGQEKCTAMMEKGFSGNKEMGGGNKENAGNLPSEGADGGPSKECIVEGVFIGQEKCKAMMEKAPFEEEKE